ncbi:TetR/AcrR family transcriptional regulator [Nostocoides australiense]
MLNSMPSRSAHTTSRVRLTPEERRRQLVGIGLRKFVERPALELSLDEVAAEAGVSRGLLFHYFPSKTAYHRAVVEAAGRRVLRTVRPDTGLTGAPAVRQIVERLIAQIVRRRASYLALVYGQAGPLHDQDDPGATATSLRAGIAELVCRALPGLDPGVTHAWVAYVEDRALHAGADTAREAAHCVAALQALRALEPAG